MTPVSYAFDQDAAVAATDLIARTGATETQFGYLHEGVPFEKAGWYAYAQYKGTRVIVEDQPGPIEAIEALARKLLQGGLCTHCSQIITLADGPGCRYRRMGNRWVRGCEGAA